VGSARLPLRAGSFRGAGAAPLSSDPTQSPAHSFVPLTVPTSLQPIGSFGLTITLHGYSLSKKSRDAIVKKVMDAVERSPDRLIADAKEMRRRMHQPIPNQGKWLGRVVRGYFNYHAVPTNGQALNVFRHHVTDLWRRTLRRRSQKDRMTWERMTQLVDAWLPKPIILHPWPSDRFAVTHPRWEPYAGKPPVRFCAGGAR
jgi:hypothetical protein